MYYRSKKVICYLWGYARVHRVTYHNKDWVGNPQPKESEYESV